MKCPQCRKNTIRVTKFYFLHDGLQECTNCNSVVKLKKSYQDYLLVLNILSGLLCWYIISRYFILAPFAKPIIMVLILSTIFVIDLVIKGKCDLLIVKTIETSNKTAAQITRKTSRFYLAFFVIAISPFVLNYGELESVVMGVMLVAAMVIFIVMK